jgi:hypothetical protein
VSEYEVEGAASASPIEARAADPNAVDVGVALESVVETTPVGHDEPATESSPVAGALAELDTLADRDLAEHPEVFERIHGKLHAALTAIDDA